MARRLRFSFILLLVALATGLAAAGGWRFARTSAPVNGPIVLISIDTLRADHLPAYGYRQVKTPALDGLAADGIVFERAYSHAPQTLPAHASILSGRLPFETGVRDDIGFAIKQGERLLPQMLRDRGYATGGVVSSYTLRKETGINQGFEFFDDDMPRAAPGTFVAPVQRDGGESEKIAERWLEQQRSQRVFLFLHVNEPHAPYAAPPAYADYSPYDAEIAYADEIVGRLIRYLKSHQLYDRATIVLLSDHGEGLGDHGEQGHGLFLYDEAIHVPLIIKQPDGAGAGQRIADIVQHIDVTPTLLDLARAPIPGNLQGRSLKSLLDGARQTERETVYSEALYGQYHFGWSELIALTADRYRYIKAPREELYDLARDPKEQINISPERAQPLLDLRQMLDRMTAGTVFRPAGEVSTEDRQRLEALGYLGAHVAIVAGSNEDAAVDPKDALDILNGYRQAAALVALSRPVPAIAILQRIARDHPLMADVWQQLGHVQLVAGRLEQAARSYERAAALTPLDARARIAAATTLIRLGRLDDAQREVEAALKVANERPGAALIAAEEVAATIAVAKKEFDRAREHAAAGERADLTVPLVTYVDGLIAYHQGLYDEALQHFQTAAAAKGSRTFRLAELHFHTAEALEQLERWDDAIPELHAELASSPRNLRARASLARVYFAAGRPEDGEQTLADLITGARTPEGYGLAAGVWSAAGMPRRAQALKAEARRLFHDDPSLKLFAQSR